MMYYIIVMVRIAKTTRWKRFNVTQYYYNNINITVHGVDVEDLAHIFYFIFTERAFARVHLYTINYTRKV